MSKFLLKILNKILTYIIHYPRYMWYTFWYNTCVIMEELNYNNLGKISHNPTLQYRRGEIDLAISKDCLSYNGDYSLTLDDKITKVDLFLSKLEQKTIIKTIKQAIVCIFGGNGIIIALFYISGIETAIFWGSVILIILTLLLLFMSFVDLRKLMPVPVN